MMPIGDEVLSALGFDRPYAVQGRASIADLIRPPGRCGIYVLHFANDEHYVGQAVDVTRRYVQHRVNHRDIHTVSFKPVRRSELNRAEREAIGAFEARGLPLRNIALVSALPGETDFDLIMPPERQEAWLADLSLMDIAGERVVDPELRRRYARRYEHFTADPNAAEITRVFRAYVHTCIPAILPGEISFWACSCFPARSRYRDSVPARLNLYWQEAFTVVRADGELWFSWHLARSPLEEVFGPSLAGLQRRCPAMFVSSDAYEPGGADQMNIQVKGYRAALEVIRDMDIRRAVRLFNLRQVRKGPCVYSRYHCLSLADALVDL